jgi:predicted lipoprotein with Yx(FWY)xxD motif
MLLQKRAVAAAAVALAAATMLSACGLISNSSSSDPMTQSTQVDSSPSVSMMATQNANMTQTTTTMSSSKGGLMEVKDTMLGLILASPHGLTVYYYSKDMKGVSNCTGSCIEAWPPVIAPVRMPAGYTLAGKIGFIVRANGQHQVTVNGMPIYRYVGDKAPGQTNGQGVGGVWWVIKVKKKGSSMSSGGMSSGGMSSKPSSSPSAASGSGGGW